jgi:hypothetical protein
MDKVSVTDPLRRVAGDTAAALLAQPTYQRDKRARQKMARAVATTERRARAATLIAVLWREAVVRNAAAATRKAKARRAEVELAVVAARAEQEQAATTNKVARAAVQARAHVRAHAQAEENTQIWVRAVGCHDSRSVMVSLKAPTGDTKLTGLGNGRLYSPQVGTLDPEKSFAAQGISKGATLSLLPRIIIGGMEGSSKAGREASPTQAPYMRLRSLVHELVYGSGLMNELGLYTGGLGHEQSAEMEAHDFGSLLLTISPLLRRVTWSLHLYPLPPSHNLTLPGIAAKDDGVSNAHSAHQNDQATSAESSSAAYVAQKFVANAVSAVTTL